MPRGRPSKTKNLEEFLSGTETFPVPVRYIARKVAKESSTPDATCRYLGISNLLRHFRVQVSKEHNRVSIYRPDTQTEFVV